MAAAGLAPWWGARGGGEERKRERKRERRERTGRCGEKAKEDPGGGKDWRNWFGGCRGRRRQAGRQAREKNADEQQQSVVGGAIMQRSRASERARRCAFACACVRGAGGRRPSKRGPSALASLSPPAARHSCPTAVTLFRASRQAPGEVEPRTCHEAAAVAPRPDRHRGMEGGGRGSQLGQAPMSRTWKLRPEGGGGGGPPRRPLRHRRARPASSAPGQPSRRRGQGGGPAGPAANKQAESIRGGKLAAQTARIPSGVARCLGRGGWWERRRTVNLSGGRRAAHFRLTRPRRRGRAPSAPFSSASSEVWPVRPSGCLQA